MSGGPGAYVKERDGVFVFVDYVRGDAVCGYLAEEAGHGCGVVFTPF